MNVQKYIEEFKTVNSFEEAKSVLDRYAFFHRGLKHLSDTEICEFIGDRNPIEFLKRSDMTVPLRLFNLFLEEACKKTESSENWHKIVRYVPFSAEPCYPKVYALAQGILVLKKYGFLGALNIRDRSILIPKHSLTIMTSEESDAIVRMLGVFPGTLLKQLHLPRCLLKMHSFSKLLTKMEDLESLDLSENVFSDEEVEILARALKNLRNLRNLVLDKCSFGSRGMIEIAAGIEEMQDLRTLSLQRNRIDSEGVPMLARSLTKLTSLEYLDLTWNPLGDPGAQSLARCLPETNIRFLILTRTCIKITGFTAIAEAINQMPAISHLNLKENGFSREGLEVLAEVIRDNETLTTFEFDDSREEEAGTILQNRMGSLKDLIRGVRHLKVLPQVEPASPINRFR